MTRTSHPTRTRLAIALFGALLCNGAAAQETQGRPSFQPDGSVIVPAFHLPPSTYLSEEARAAMRVRAALPSGSSGATRGFTIEELRANTEKALASRVQAMLDRYPVKVEDSTVEGVPVKVFTPAAGEPHPERLLINLHGGAFQTCWPSCALLESAPIAATGRVKVISVDYRQGPEYTFPAASEDIEKVYRAALRKYRPQKVGIFGCSAGGVLTAQAVAWIQDKKLPVPGAIGIFGAAAGRAGRGDSAYTAAYIGGEFPPPADENGSIDVTPPGIRSYFEGADLSSPLVSPVESAQVIAGFPPSLLVTGTRAMDLSGTVHSHFTMKKQGVNAELLVAEGLGHCYIYDASLPEARDTIDMIADFFDRHL